MEPADPSPIIEKELDYLMTVEPTAIIYGDYSIRMSLAYTRIKKGDLHINFPEKYPNEPLITDFKSSSIPDRLLVIFNNKIEAQCKVLAKEGKP